MNPVLCISRSALAEQFTEEEGAHPYHFKLEDIDSKHLHLINRSVADSKDPADLVVAKHLPQLLPYVLVECNGEYLTYSRAKGTEDRLHGTLSLGLGGHVELEDIDHTNFSLVTGLMRELDEELHLDINSKYVLTKEDVLLVDTTNEVGQVHVGYLYILSIEAKENVKPDPSEIHLPVWKTKEEIAQEVDRYEVWSQVIINQLWGK